MHALLGVDLGTTNLKALLADERGRTLAVYRESVVYDRASPRRCELPADRFAATLARCIRGVCERAGVDGTEIEGVSYASQANSFLLLDAEGLPLTPIISWLDARVERPDPAVEELWRCDRFLEITGLGVRSSQLAVVKIAELRRTPVWSKVGGCLTISDYLIFLLTGERVGDQSTASMLGFFDIRRDRWWSEALEALSIDDAVLVRPIRPGRHAGTVCSRAAAAFGLSTGTPVYAGGLDHYLAAVGAGADTLAEACESTGTVIACVTTGSDLSAVDGGSLGPACDGEYLLTFDSRGGVVLESYRDKWCPDYSFADLDALAAKAPAGAGGVRAEMDSEGGVSFSFPADATDDSREERIGREVRAILEATARRLRSLLLAAATDVTRVPARVVSTGGGARSEVWTKIKSSMTGSRFYTLAVTEPAAYGAAFLAGRGTGLVASESAGLPDSWIAVRSVTDPDPADRAFYARWLSEQGETRRWR